MATTARPPIQDADEQRLAEMGYKQELKRTWSAFQNFGISFTIISILAGCFTTYYQAWNNGGPIAISWGWPIISAFILLIAFCMAELVSAYPTAGGIYWWSAKLGRPVWGWFTGWFNLLGLIAILASVDYFSASSSAWSSGSTRSTCSGLNFGDSLHGLREVFILFAIILALHVVINIRGSHLVARLNSVSVVWHVFGALAIIVILVVVPDHHASADFVFTEPSTTRASRTRCSGGTCCRSGFLLTQYTITGFDARRTSPRRPTARTSPPPGGCGSPCSTPRSAATSCCSRPPSRCPIPPP